MKKKFLLYSLCLLTLITCKSGSTEIERLTLSPSSTIQDSLFTQLPGSLILCNNYLVWEDPFNPNYFLHVVDINAKKEIGTMGLIGRGPKEFITPLSISSIGNKIFTYDLNQNKQAYYSIDSMLANKTTTYFPFTRKRLPRYGSNSRRRIYFNILKMNNSSNGFIKIQLYPFLARVQ
ncbi:MAG: hypothetical protein ACLU4J_15250 [Butyricimonas paravirosa]